LHSRLEGKSLTISQLKQALRPFNCYSHLDLYRSDLCVDSRMVPGFFGGFLVMNIEFIAALGSETRRIASELLSGAFCAWDRYVALPITSV
jgi:hypothetical protein